ncbi:potassium channel family protein [Nocardiopsis halotolerans]|uniref:potassium channel family protein n=1 Tax=Nocardiopsis halotolerans TaxID=124252 RepID=UPI000349BD08|nr:potassium channel family protein [Nocardiopsis halotolerans]
MVFVSLLGTLLIVLIACDVATTVLHPDSEGVVAGRVRKAVWGSTVLAGARLPRAKQRLVSLTGPLILAATFVSWVLLLTLGLALAVWPMMGEEFRIRTGLGPLGFLDALYFAGGTVTVLGYGDLTPASPGSQLVSLFGAAIGFTLFTGMATYAIQVLSGVTKRNQFTLSVHDDVRGRDGVTMLAEYLALDGASGVRTHCRNWADSMRLVDETVRRYPLVALTYRSRRQEYSPEPALRHMAEATVAALVASGHEPTLRPSAESLRLALVRLQRTIALTYLGGDVVHRLDDPQPTEHDQRMAHRVERLLRTRLDGLGASTGPGPVPGEDHRTVVETVHRCRIFLDGLHGWERTEGPSHEWETR